MRHVRYSLWSWLEENQNSLKGWVIIRTKNRRVSLHRTEDGTNIILLDRASGFTKRTALIALDDETIDIILQLREEER